MRSTSVTRAMLVVALAFVAVAARGSSALDERLDRLPDRYRKWIEQEVVYIISDVEREAFLDLQSVEEWEAFVEAFWRQRDPDPLTPVNEFREEHYLRLEYANTLLGRDSAVPGWMTDRGKMYIILGEPDEKDSFRSVPGIYPAEVWFYLANKEKALPPLLLLFFQEGHAGPYRLFNHAIDGPEKLMPGASLNPENDRLEIYQHLQTISPELAQATVTARADRGAYGYIFDFQSSSLDFMSLLGDIYVSPHRRVDTRYVDAAGRNRGLVESEYLFNFVPSAGVADVVAGPNGRHFVHYSIEVEPQHLTLANDGTSYYTTFELAGEVTASDGETTVLRLSKERHVKLTESEFQRIRHRPFAYRSMFPLVEGEFQLRLILKNRARSEYTIFEAPLVVPEAGGGARLGEPMLLYSPATPESPDSEDYRTYQLGSMELDPNARRIYALGEDIVVYVPVEGADPDDALSLRVEALDGALAAEPPKTSRAFGDYRGGRVVETLSTEGWEGGRYRLVVDLERGSGAPPESRSVAFDIVPHTRVATPWVLSDSIDGNDGGVVLASLAEQHVALGEMADAVETSRRALAEAPGLPAPRVFLARVALDEGDPGEAIELLTPVVESDPGNVDALLTLADASVRVGDYARAVELFEASIALRRPAPALLNALAACHNELGNREAARAYLEQSLALDPDQEKVRFLLERLQASTPR